MVGYMLPLMTIAVLSHMTSIPSSAAAPHNYALPPLHLLETSMITRERSLEDRSIPSHSYSSEDDKSFFADDNDSSSTSSSSWEEANANLDGNHITKDDSPSPARGTRLVNNRIRIGDATSPILINEAAATNDATTSRQTHESNFLRGRSPILLLDINSNNLEMRPKRQHKLPTSQVIIDETVDYDELASAFANIEALQQDNGYGFMGFGQTGKGHSAYTNGNDNYNFPPKQSSEIHRDYDGDDVVGHNSVFRTRGLGGPEKLTDLSPDNLGESIMTTFTRNNAKRSPRCLRRCLAQGLLHPSQCHSLC